MSGRHRVNAFKEGLSFLGLIGLVVITIQATGKPWENTLFLGCLFYFLAWAVLALVTSMTAIRPKSISDSELVLTHVSPVFIDALVQSDTDQPAAKPRRRGSL